MSAAARPDPDAVLDEVGAAFARLRRRTALFDVDPPVTRQDLVRNQIINIVDEADGEVTVGYVADQMSVDSSQASRMVSGMIKDGLLIRQASQLDGRRTIIELTDAGRGLRDRFRSQHRQAFLEITHEWPAQKRRDFAALLVDYADACVAATNRRRPEPE